MEWSRHGDVLAGRYRLQDLLSEQQHGRFWRADDEVLGRAVAILVLSADDPRTPGLMNAARASASVADPRLLRVLDADTANDVAYVVNEWGTGTSLDQVLASDGPLPPKRAAEIATELSETIATAHARGYAHGRLSPENVLIDPLGGIRIIGFAVEAALHGLAPGRMSIDVTDLGGILYAALTGYWPGASESAVPAAPTTPHRHLMSPRQVRAGVPRQLDDMCERVLGVGTPTIRDAQGLHVELAEFIGRLVDLPGVRAEVPAATPVRDPNDPEATQPGLPAFVTGEEDEADAPPPPPPPPARPLFADEGPDDQYAPEPSAPPPAPWDSGAHALESAHTVRPVPPTRPPNAPVALAEEPGAHPGRNWIRLAIGIGIAIAVFVGALVVFNLGDDGGEPEADDPQTTASPSAKPSRIRNVAVRDYDPYGDPPNEYPDLAGYVVDGDPTTTWRTKNYIDQIGQNPRSLKPGVGLILDLKKDVELRSLNLTMLGEPTHVKVLVSDASPGPTETPDESTAVTEQTLNDGKNTIKLGGDVSGSYVVIWLTELPDVGGEFRGEISEISVRGVVNS